MKCKRCKAKIEYLNYSAFVREYGEFDLESGFEKIDEDPDGTVQFSCPECDEVITHDEEQAVKLLKKHDK